MKTLLATLLLAAFIPALAGAQSSAWTSFLHGRARDELDEAVQRIEIDWATAATEYRSRYQTIEDRYVLARSENLDRLEYAESLGDIQPGVDDTDSPANATAEPSPRRRIALALGEEIPLPGTRSFATAGDWLAALAEREGFPVEEFGSLLRLVEESVLSSLSANEAYRFSAALPVPTENLPDDLDPEDTARQRIAMWELLVLASDDEGRVVLLGDIERALVELSFLEAREIAAGFRSIRAEREQVIELESHFPIAADVLAVVSPFSIGDPERLSNSPAVLEDFTTLVFALADAATEASIDVYRARGDAAFFVDTVQSLLASASDLQRYTVARAMGVRRSELEHAAAKLYLLRSVAARLPEWAERLPTSPARSDSAFSAFLETGAEHVADAAPWAAGDRSRSGDSYRWAMLPILSHPYAQYLLATVPELVDTRIMLDDFVAGVYESTLRSLEIDTDAISAIVLGDALQPLSRVYEVSRSATATELYDSFAAIAQGAEQLSADFGVPYTAGLTLAGYWSHMHGLHVSVVEDRTMDREGTVRLVRARVDAWFALARSVDTEQEELSLTLRGLLALRRVIQDELLPVVSSAGIATYEIYEPRLPVVLSLLDRVADFTADPFVIRSRLADLYAAPEGDATNDLIAADLARLLARLRDVEIADRRVLRRLAGSEAR